MTREEEEARCVEIEAMKLSPGNNLQRTYRAHMERRWMLEDAGIPDMMRIKVERMVAAVEKKLGN